MEAPEYGCLHVLRRVCACMCVCDRMCLCVCVYVRICTYLVLWSVGSDGVDEWGGAWSLPVETVVLATQLGQQALGWKVCTYT